MGRITTVAAILAAAGSAMAQWSDDFNRANGPVGGNWVTAYGTFTSFQVDNNRGASTVAGNHGMIESTTNIGYADVEHVIDVHINTTGLEYVALVIGRGGTNNLVVKVQSQTSNGFGHIGFYMNNAGSNTTLWPGSAPAFFEMVGIRFNDARMKIYFTNSGDTINLEFDTNFDGTPEHVFTRNGVNAISSTFGRQHGIGAYGTARFDNWRVGPAGPPPCYADCDTSTGVGVLDIFDFLCFQNRFAASTAYACECDTSTGPGVCDIFDFLCFQNAFAAGCP